MSNVILVDGGGAAAHLSAIVRAALSGAGAMPGGARGETAIPEPLRHLEWPDGLDWNSMPAAERLKRCREQAPETLLLIRVLDGDRELRLAVAGAFHDEKPAEPAPDPGDAAGRALPFLEDAGARRRAAAALHELDLRLWLVADPRAVTMAGALLVDAVAPLFPPEEIDSIRVGLFETVQNGVEHGSLEISYDEKTRAMEEDMLAMLHQDRRDDPEFRDRIVDIDLTFTDDACAFRIADEGPGFDWRKWVADIDPVAALETHGRGILMTKFYFDEIAYNEAGNVITVTKRFIANEN
ncbi:ATP-binding protein [bacterium]|nr:ATP-binding protein [bacterium]